MNGDEGTRLITVATYNIHECVGLDGRRSAARIAEVLMELEADIIGLQEVHSMERGDPESRQLEYLAARTGMTAIPGATLFRNEGHYGNALLTRYPVRAIRNLELSVGGREPRAAIDVDLEVHDRRVRILTTHLGLSPAERRVQVARLLLEVDKSEGGPLILMGDINEWYPLGRPLRWIHARLGRAPTCSSFPANRPVAALDRVWVRPREALERVAAHGSPLARVASDHLPVRARIRMPAP